MSQYSGYFVVPSRNTLIRWVEVFRTTGKITKTKPPRTVRTPKHYQNESGINQESNVTERTHAQELHMSRYSVRKIL